jgi:hypothetical protein
MAKAWGTPERPQKPEATRHAFQARVYEAALGQAHLAFGLTARAKGGGAAKDCTSCVHAHHRDT